MDAQHGCRRDKNPVRLHQGNGCRYMDDQRSGGVQGDADGAVIRRAFIEQRMQVADRQQHGDQ